MRNIARYFVPLAVVISLLSGLVYMTAQQVIRLGANEPQIQIAQDAAYALSTGQPVESVLPTGRVDISSSLAPFVVVYDDAGRVVASSGFLDGQAPSLPSGVFDYVRKNGEDRISWQPAAGVRSAIVITRYSGKQSGFVMAGRSLREAEKRISGLGLLISFGWLGTMLAALISVVACELLFATGSPIGRLMPRHDASVGDLAHSRRRGHAPD